MTSRIHTPIGLALAGVLAGCMLPGVAWGAAPQRRCATIYQAKRLHGKRVVAYRSVKAQGVSCATTRRVLMTFLRSPQYVKFFPKHSAHPRSMEDYAKTHGGWRCTQYFPHYGPPLGNGRTTCRKGASLAKGLYIP